MGTQSNKANVYKEAESMFGIVPEWVKQMPDSAVESFWTLMRDFNLAETKIPNKYKELIGLGVAGATRCRYCALFHTEAARLNGATDEEIAEASMMAGQTMMASTFLNAQQIDYDVFRREMQQIVSYVRKQQAAGNAPSAKSPERTAAQPH